ncbi:MAG: TRAP transporter small permease [Rhizobium sp.]|nr:TRAP transporter small permease [Rhizobium sp.]
MQDKTSSGAVGQMIHRIAEGVALLGGLCLLAAAILTGISIAGSVTYRPLPGEIEVVEILCGLAVFAFLPYCQLHKGHVGVDLLVSALGKTAVNWTQLFGDVVITVLIALIAWRHWIGTADKFGNGEFTPILSIPIWWGYAAAMVMLAINVIVSAWTVYADIRDIREGIAIEPSLRGHG